jgi:YD repeat-containing protein
MAEITIPAATRAIAVQPGQPIAMTADTSTDWWQRNLTTGGAGGAWTQINPGGTNVSTLVWTTPTTVSNRQTFDRLQLAVNTTTAPSTAFTGGLHLNLVEGPPAVLYVSPSLGGDAMAEPPLRPWEGEDDDPPLGAPLYMPGASRGGLGTELLETPGVSGGPANAVQAYDRGLLVDTAGKLAVRVPFTSDVRGLGPFPAIASYHHGGMYFEHDFGKSRTLGLTRVLYQDADGHVAIVRGDGRRNTYRSTGGGAFTAAASLRNTLAEAGGVFTETTPSGRVYRYTSAGRLERVVDRAGSAAYYAYDINNRLQKIQGLSGTLGLVPYLSYDGSGLLTRLVLEDQVTPANNRVSYLQYDGSRNLTRIIGPEGCITYFGYDGSGLYLTSITDPENFTWSAGYDGSNRVDRIVDAASPRATAYLAYDTAIPQVRHRDRAGKVTYFVFGAFGSPERVYNLGTPADYYAYDGEGNLTQAKNRLGAAWSSEYDALANRISVTDPLGARAYYAYDGQDLLRTVVDPLGRATYMTYDGARNRERWIDALGNTAYYQYESTGLLRCKRDRRGAFTYFVFDARANLTAVNDALGQATYLAYNTANEQTAQVDPLGRISYLERDLRGRVTRSLDPLGAPTYLAYDARCNLVSQKDALLHQTVYQYDGNSNRTRVVDALGFATYLTYDPEERPATQTDALLRQTSWTYDALGRRQTQTDALGGVTYMGYDAAHELTLQRDARNNPTYLRYDLAGRTSHRIDAAFAATYLGYDLKGRPVRTVAPGFAAATGIYWTDSGNDTIKRCDPDGSNVTTVISSGLNVPRGLVVDPVGGFLYWIDSGTDTISRSTLAGGSVVPIVSSGLSTPRDLVVDLLNGVLYWIDSGNDTIKRANLDGSGIVTILSLGASKTPEALALDGPGQKLYWTDSQANTVERCDVDGSNRVTVVNTGATSPAGLALDVADRHVYWAESGANTIRRASMDGTDVGVVTLVSGLGDPRGISLDLVERKMYWVDSMSDKVQRANLDGTDVTDLVTTGLATPEGLTLALAPRVTDTAFDPLDRVTSVTDALGAVRSSTFDAEGNRLRSIDPRGYATYMTYDPLGRQTHTQDALGGVTYVGYDRAGQAVVRLDPLGYPAYMGYDPAGRQRYATNALLQTTTQGYDLVGNQVSTLLPSAAEALYWTDSSPGNEAIKRCRPDGSGLVTLVSGADLDIPRGIVVDAQHGYMYWLDSGLATLKRASLLDGSGVTTLVSSGLSTPRGLAIDVAGGHLYWVDSGNDTIKRVPLAGGAVTTLLTAGTGGLSSPDGLALDLAARQMYWTDSGNDTIKRASLDAPTTTVQTLVSTGLSAPAELDLDVVAGQMYWIDSGNDTIKRANMEDGLGVTTLVDTGLTTPRGLRLDLAARVMYWIDSGTDKLERANLDGTGRIDVLTSGLLTPENLALEVPVRVTTRAFDAVNRQVTRTDAYGSVSTSVHDAVGNVTAQVDARGFATYLTYDDLNRRVSSQDSVHFAPTYTGYDAVGNTVLQLDPQGAATYLTFDRLNRVSFGLDPAGLRTYHAYDEVGARTFGRQILGPGGEERLSYFRHDPVGRVYAQVAPDGGQTYLGYDLAGNQTLAVDPVGRPTYMTFDALNRQATRSNALGNTWATDFDARSSVLRQRDPEGRTAYMSYDALGRRSSQGNALGETSTFEFDVRGNQARVQNPRGFSTYMTFDLLDRQTHRIDALDGMAYMGYDVVGNVVLRSGPEESNFLGIYYVDSDDNAQIRRVGLDGTGNASVSSEANGINALAVDLTTPGGKLYWCNNNSETKRANLDGSNQQTIIAEAGSRMVLDVNRGRIYFSDFPNERVRSANLDGSDVQTFISTTGDSAYGLAVDSRSGTVYYTLLVAGTLRRRNFDGTGDTLILSGLTSPQAVSLDLVAEKLYWTESGSTIKRANLDGSSTETILTGLSLGEMSIDVVRGRLYWIAFSPSFRISSSTLNGTDQQTVVLAAGALGLSIPQRVTLSSFDGLNRTTHVRDARFAVTYMGYDDRSSLVKRVDADGRATYMGYDVARRLERTFFANSMAGETADSPIYYGYDQVGNRIYTDDRLQGLDLTYFVYDRLDRTTVKRTMAGAVYYAYDLSGMKQEMKDADEHLNYHVHDAAGRLDRIVLDGGRTAYYHHDLSGMVLKKLLPDNRVMSYFAYDVAGRLTQLTHCDDTGAPIAYFAYQRNASGTPVWIRREGGLNHYYEYDALNRLTLDQLNSSSAVVYGFRYAYDAASNRSIKTDTVAARATYYTNDARNLLTKEFVLQTGATNYFDHDAARRMTVQRSSTEARYFAYDQGARPTQIRHAAGSPDAVHYFSYNGAGERVRVVEGSTEAYWSYDGSKLIRERRSDDTFGTFRVYRHNKSAADKFGTVLEVESQGFLKESPAQSPPCGKTTRLTAKIDDVIPAVAYFEYDAFGVRQGVSTTNGGMDTGQRLQFGGNGLIRLGTGPSIYLAGSGLYVAEVGLLLGAAAGAGPNAPGRVNGGPVVADPDADDPSDEDLCIYGEEIDSGCGLTVADIRRAQRGRMAAALVWGANSKSVEAQNRPEGDIHPEEFQQKPGTSLSQNSILIEYTPTSQIAECCSKIMFAQLVRVDEPGTDPILITDPDTLRKFFIPDNTPVWDDGNTGKIFYNRGPYPDWVPGQPHAFLRDSPGGPAPAVSHTTFDFETCAICVEPRNGGPADDPSALTTAVLGCVKWGADVAWWRSSNLYIEDNRNAVVMQTLSLNLAARQGKRGFRRSQTTVLVNRVFWDQSGNLVPAPSPAPYLSELRKAFPGSKGDFFTGVV